MFDDLDEHETHYKYNYNVGYVLHLVFLLYIMKTLLC